MTAQQGDVAEEQGDVADLWYVAGTTSSIGVMWRSPHQQ